MERDAHIEALLRDVYGSDEHIREVYGEKIGSRDSVEFFRDLVKLSPHSKIKGEDTKCTDKQEQ